jgi:uncharacterized protein
MGSDGERKGPRAESVLVRGGYLCLGFLCVGLGALGWVLPVMPGTVFFIIALWSFKRSSPKLEHWLLNHRVVGPTLQDWDRYKGIRPRTKAIAIVFIWAAIGLSIYVAGKWYVTAILLTVAAALTAYLWTRPNVPERDPQVQARAPRKIA